MHKMLTFVPFLLSVTLGVLSTSPRDNMANWAQIPTSDGEHSHSQDSLFLDDSLIPISELLVHPNRYHQQMITVRGTVTRLELHLDASKHFIDFVFWLKEGDHRVLVFGQHDRTVGDIQLVTDRMVEVRGLFWKERYVEEYRLTNNLEAQQVRFYPPVSPDRT